MGKDACHHVRLFLDCLYISSDGDEENLAQHRSLTGRMTSQFKAHTFMHRLLFYAVNTSGKC